MDATDAMPPSDPHAIAEMGADEVRTAVGQLLMVGFEGADDRAPAAVADAVSAGRVGGVILFRRNIDTVEQVSALNAHIHRLGADAAEPPLVAVDQEGGRVVRLEAPLTPIPPMRALGQTNDPGLIADASEVIATELEALGFNLNFAPVIDVDTNPDNPIIGDRAFGADPDSVARAAGAYLLGHHTAGVIPCGKHFPGHGDTLVDSHRGLPVVDHDRPRLDRVELAPFRRMIAAQIPMLMTAHLTLRAIDADRPATLSQPVIDGLLRRQLGYDGVVITDDLEMEAVAASYDTEQMVTMGLRAGVDIFLICHTRDKWRRAYDRLVDMATRNADDKRRVARAARRVVGLKRAFLGNRPRPWTPRPGWRDILGAASHREVMDQISGRVGDIGADDRDDPTAAD